MKHEILKDTIKKQREFFGNEKIDKMLTIPISVCFCYYVLSLSFVIAFAVKIQQIIHLEFTKVRYVLD